MNETFGDAYYGRWREWVESPNGKIEWKQVKRKLYEQNFF